MELTGAYFAARELLAQIEESEELVQMVMDSGVSHVENPARVTWYNEKHLGEHSVAISLAHFDLIKDILPEEMIGAQEKGSFVRADGLAFPGEYESAIKTALVARNIAWKRVYVSKKPW